MLGCTEIAALTHLQENLLDLLRKGERADRRATTSTPCCKAGDMLRLQVLHRRGAAAAGARRRRVEALLRERVAQPAADAPTARPAR